MKKPYLFLCLLCLAGTASAQKLFFAKSNYTDSVAFEKNIPELAKQVLEKYPKADNADFYDDAFRLQLVAKEYGLVKPTLDRRIIKMYGDTTSYGYVGFITKVYAATMIGIQRSGGTFAKTYDGIFEERYKAFGLENRDWVAYYLTVDPKFLKENFEKKIKSLSGADSLSLTDATALCVNYCSYKVYSAITGQSRKMVARVEKESYITDDSVLVKMPDGGTVSLIIVRDGKATAPQPVIMKYNIYANVENDLFFCKKAVWKGYIGIVANTRGKRLSPDALEPFEHDAKDAYYIIDWISKQPWCNGKVGMYGGSYLGFSQWSAVKYLHPALKTIVPQVAAGPGIDFPAQNGSYQTYVLRWLHLVMDGKLTDYAGFRDTAKWNSLFARWYKNGFSMRSMDTVEGRPNAIYQRWLNHPAYDHYWQDMTPQKDEFAKINIPILTTTGYWDDDQLGAMYYYNQYQKYNKNPNYYLLMGPYDHIGSQGYPKNILGGYKIDNAANISIDSLIFEWFDYVLKGAPRPAILQDKVNFEVMGENKWRHVPTIDQMHNDTLTLYLGNTLSGKQYSLLTEKPKKPGYILQSVDLSDRRVIDTKGDDIYAFDHLIDSALNPEKEKLMFVSQPVEKPYAISGALTANILASINKKDMDIVIDLYEQTPDGKFMALGEVVQRASLIKDRTKRQLLHPGKIEKINIKNTFITSKLLQKGSRIIVLIGVNKNIHWQINYGTGKDVSDETIKDAAIPMEIRWYIGSCIKLPVLL